MSIYGQENSERSSQMVRYPFSLSYKKKYYKENLRMDAY